MSWQTLSALLDVFTSYFFSEAEWDSCFFVMNKLRVDFFLLPAGKHFVPLPISPAAFTWDSLSMQEA